MLRHEQAGPQEMGDLPPEHLLCHKPADPRCPACLQAKLARAPQPRGSPDDQRVVDEITEDNVLVHMDTLTSSLKDIRGCRYAQCSYDQGSHYRRAVAHHGKTPEDVLAAFQEMHPGSRLTADADANGVLPPTSRTRSRPTAVPSTRPSSRRT